MARLQLVTYSTTQEQLDALLAFCQAQGIDYEQPEEIQDDPEDNEVS